MLEYDEMFCSFLRITCSVLTKCLRRSYISQFLIVLACSWLDSLYTSVRTRCFDNWSISRFRFIIVHKRLYLKFWRDALTTINISQLAVLSLITCSEMFLIKVLDQMRFTTKTRPGIVSHEWRFLYDFCSIYNTFVLISRCLHRDARSEVVYIVDVSL